MAAVEVKPCQSRWVMERFVSARSGFASLGYRNGSARAGLGKDALQGRGEGLVAFDGGGFWVVPRFAEDLSAHFDADGAGVVELFEEGEEREVVDAAFAGQDKAEPFLVFHGVFHVDEAGLWQEGAHAGFHLDSLELEVAEVVGGCEGGGGNGFEEEGESFGRVDGAVDVGFEGDDGAMFFGGFGPAAQVCDHAVFELVPFSGFATENGFDDGRLGWVEVQCEGGCFFEEGNPFRDGFFADEREVHHEAGHPEFEVGKLSSEGGALLGTEGVRIGYIPLVESDFDVVVSDGFAELEGFAEGDGFHPIEAEPEAGFGGCDGTDDWGEWCESATGD